RSGCPAGHGSATPRPRRCRLPLLRLRRHRPTTGARTLPCPGCLRASWAAAHGAVAGPAVPMCSPRHVFALEQTASWAVHWAEAVERLAVSSLYLSHTQRVPAAGKVSADSCYLRCPCHRLCIPCSPARKNTQATRGAQLPLSAQLTAIITIC